MFNMKKRFEAVAMEAARMAGRVSAGISDMKNTNTTQIASRVLKAAVQVVKWTWNGIKIVASHIKSNAIGYGVAVGAGIVGTTMASTVCGASILAAVTALSAVLAIHMLIAKRNKQAMQWKVAILTALNIGAFASMMPWLLSSMLALIIFVVFNAMFQFMVEYASARLAAN